MLKIRNILAVYLLLSLSACSNQIRDGHVLLDMDWEQDIYNLVYTHVDDVDNLRFRVRKPPEYTDGSPYKRACVEVKEAFKPSKFYVANLNTYGFHEVPDCDNSYLDRATSEEKRVLIFF